MKEAAVWTGAGFRGRWPVKGPEALSHTGQRDRTFLDGMADVAALRDLRRGSSGKAAGWGTQWGGGTWGVGRGAPGYLGPESTLHFLWVGRLALVGCVCVG